MSERNYKIKIKEGNFEFEIEGDKNFVEKYYTQIKDDLLNNNSILFQKSHHIEDQINIKEETMLDFYKLKRPENHNENLLIIAYWQLIKQNIEEFNSTKDILKAYDIIRLKKPSNIHQHIGELKKDGFIMPGEQSGFYKLTLTGIEYVENNLPKKKDS